MRQCPVGAHGAEAVAKLKLLTMGTLKDRERERDLLQVPHFFVGTLQPL